MGACNVLKATGPSGAYVGVPAIVVNPPVRAGVEALLAKGVAELSAVFAAGVKAILNVSAMATVAKSGSYRTRGNCRRSSTD